MGRAPSSSLKTLNFSSISFVLSLNPLRKIPVDNENIPHANEFICQCNNCTQKRAQTRFRYYSVPLEHASLPRFCARLGSRSVFAAGFVGAVWTKKITISIKLTHQDALFEDQYRYYEQNWCSVISSDRNNGLTDTNLNSLFIQKLERNLTWEIFKNLFVLLSHFLHI